MRGALTVATLLFSLCDGDDGGSYCNPKLGTRADLTIAVGAPTRPTIDEPTSCSATTPAMLITVRGFGKRRFSDNKGIDICEIPGDPGCHLVNRASFEVYVERTLGGRVSDMTRSTCDGAKVGIRDWRQANDAVAAIDKELERWNLADPYVISVESGVCFVAE